MPWLGYFLGAPSRIETHLEFGANWGQEECSGLIRLPRDSVSDESSLSCKSDSMSAVSGNSIRSPRRSSSDECVCRERIHARPHATPRHTQKHSNARSYKGRCLLRTPLGGLCHQAPPFYRLGCGSCCGILGPCALFAAFGASDDRANGGR